MGSFFQKLGEREAISMEISKGLSGKWFSQTEQSGRRDLLQNEGSVVYDQVVGGGKSHHTKVGEFLN